MAGRVSKQRAGTGSAKAVAEQLRQHGLRVRERTRVEPVEPLDVPGLKLAEALDELHGSGLAAREAPRRGR